MKIATMLAASMCLLFEAVGSVLYSKANKNDDTDGKSKAFVCIRMGYLFLFVSMILVVIRIVSVLIPLL